ncbi:MAG: transcription elongation factor GreB [Burkholderiales bacterium]|nr:transcription elongation factor GreB [Burkholderiales bacterium]
MSKAFTREPDAQDAVSEASAAEAGPPVPGGRNYMTPAGYLRLKGELKKLVEIERPETVRVVSWAASNGDRSENGDYIYGKRRLREIDRRVRYLMKRLEAVEVVDPRDQDQDRVFFGASVRYADAGGTQREVSIVGIDEADPARGRISWVSPLARALLRTREGDTVVLRAPHGAEEIEVLEVRYQALE